MGVSSFTKPRSSGAFFCQEGSACIPTILGDALLSAAMAVISARIHQRPGAPMHIDGTLRPISRAFALTFAARTAIAADCKPRARGTGPALVVDPTQHGRICTLQL